MRVRFPLSNFGKSQSFPNDLKKEAGGIVHIPIPDPKRKWRQRENGQVNLIRRREETAATRSLLNTAKLMENNPLLLCLKELESLEKLTEKVGRIDLHTGEQGGFDALMTKLLTLS